MNDQPSVIDSSPRDTIVAISSPPGRSLRGLVRLAGPNSAAVLGAVTHMSSALDAGKIASTKLRSPLPEFACLVGWFAGPNSYSGDNVAEIQCPGNPALLSQIVQRALSVGARLAEPGEFTFRAFSSGKLDLIETEGVAATISAVSDSQLQAASLLRGGKLSQLAANLVDELANGLALVEAGIDFVDQEDVVAITPDELAVRLKQVLESLGSLLSRSRSWSQLEDLPRVVLAGKPSAGKSMLFNALLNKTRAVVSPVAGTTRDILEEPLALQTRRGKIEVMLVDLAGLDTLAPSTVNDDGALNLLDSAQIRTLNQEAQNAALQQIQQADVVLLLRPSDGKISEDGFTFIKKNMPDKASCINVITKFDLLSGAAENSQSVDGQTLASCLATSAVTGAGMDELQQTIARCVEKGDCSVASEKLALQPRHEYALRAAENEIKQAMAMLENKPQSHQLDDMELVASVMRGALDQLASLGGQMTADDVLGKIFATFCVGK